MRKILTLVLIIFTNIVLAKTHVVLLFSDMENKKFYMDPEEITISSGDTIKWINSVDDFHNVVSYSIPNGAENFTSPMMKKKSEEWSHTFTTKGVYKYHCQPHSFLGMKAVIIVK